MEIDNLTIEQCRHLASDIDLQLKLIRKRIRELKATARKERQNTAMEAQAIKAAYENARDEEIFELKKRCTPLKDIATRYNLSQSKIRNICWHQCRVQEYNDEWLMTGSRWPKPTSPSSS